MGPQEKKLEQDIEMLYEQRTYYDKGRVRASDALDRYLLTISTGSLYLTFLITSHFGRQSKLAYFEMIIAGLFVVTIIATLLSIMLSVSAYKRQTDIATAAIERKLVGKNTDSDLNCWNGPIKWSRIFSLATFLLSTILLTIYYFLITKSHG